MEEYKLTEIEQLRLTYQEIIQGYSVTQDHIIRHLTELDHIEVLRKKTEFYARYIREGVPSDEAKLASLIQNEEWTQVQEDRILNLRYIISDNERNLRTLVPQQHPTVRHMIKEKRLELTNLLLERQYIFGLTANEASEKDTFNYMVYLSLFKDTNVKLFANEEDFENQEEDKIQEYVKEIDVCLARFQESMLRKISVMPFFLNAFSYSKESIYTFLAKPMVSLTHYQMLLFSLGTRNLNIMSQAEGEPPELLGDIPVEKLVDWYDGQFSIILGKRHTTK